MDKIIPIDFSNIPYRLLENSIGIIFWMKGENIPLKVYL